MPDQFPPSNTPGPSGSNVEDIFGDTTEAPVSMPPAGVSQGKSAGPSMPSAALGPSMPSSSGGMSKQTMIMIGAGVVLLAIIVTIGLMIGGVFNATAPQQAAQTNTTTQPDTTANPATTTPSTQTPSTTTTQPSATTAQPTTTTQTSSMVDTDGDGLTDEEEAKLGTSKDLVDTDNDGLTDREEVNVWRTNPTNSDTDGDGFLDGEEVKNGYNPNGPGKILTIPTELNPTSPR